MVKVLETILLPFVLASHYRGGTYKVRQQENDMIKIVNTQTWRRGKLQYFFVRFSTFLGFDMYENNCQPDDVIQQNPSDVPMPGQCWAGSCQSADLSYTVLFVADNYCYGDGENFIPRPENPYIFGWRSRAWVPFTDDLGQEYGDNWSMIHQFMWMYDPTNNTPDFKLPPLWLIMAGCPNQEIDLAPHDFDGDTVRCRWAVGDEAGGAELDPVRHPSLSLDGDNCIVKYDGTLDASQVGVKPIALMMEDFDSQGNIRSSVPVQFLAQVWTPTMNRNGFIVRKI